MKKNNLQFLLIILISFFAANSFSQTKGLIYKPAGSGAIILDPNGDGYTSQTSAGFDIDDEVETEIPYTPLPVYGGGEPDSDLGPGPNCSFTDLVKSDDNHSIYTYLDENSNFMFRFRLGGTADNSKAYSILIDTDQKFGASGANADPNYVQGNPGFEVEIVLMTNFGVGLYDVDGTISPIEIGDATIDRPYNDFAQKSIAGSEICDNPDYFYDFYIPFSELTSAFGITTSTPLRMVGNTVINPHESTGNNGISDLGGIDDSTGIIDDLWEDLIDVFPPTSAGEIGSGSTLPPRAACPAISGTISIGSTSVAGTSAEVDGATIELYKNGISLGTTSVNAGAWSFSGLSAAQDGDVYTATARVSSATASATSSTEKSESYSSCNETIVMTVCTEAPIITGMISGSKGLTGTTTGPAQTVITIYEYPSGDIWSGASSTNNPITTSTVNETWTVAGQTGNSFPDGIYYATAKAPGQCESPASNFYCKGVGTSTTPVINTSPITEETTSLSGTSGSGAFLEILIDGQPSSYSATATGTTWSISGISGLTAGQEIIVRSTDSGNCPSLSAAVPVQKRSQSPTIQGSYCTSSGSITSVSGISSEAGGTIKIYTSTSSPVDMNTSVATTTVASNGSWTANVSIPEGNFIVATVTNTGDLESTASNEVEVFSQTNDDQLDITSGPVTEGDASISGTGTDGNTVYLYLDGYVVDGFEAVVSGGTWTISGLDAASAGYDVLYAGAVTGVTAKNGALCESEILGGPTVQCNPPIAQTYSAITPTTICEGETITVRLDATEDLVVYELIDENDNAIGPAVLGNSSGTSANLTSFALYTTDNISNIRIKAQRV